MTEEEWLACDRPMAMMYHLIEREEADQRSWRRWVPSLISTSSPKRATDNPNRRTYLLACGIRRHWLERFPEEARADCHVEWSESLQLEEEFAEGLVSLDTILSTSPNRQWHWPHPWHLVSNVIRGNFRCGIAREGTGPMLSAIIRDIFGNPFRPVALNAAWLGQTVAGLAEAIYQERAFDRLPILADALEDVGCTNADILNHCRQPGEHVRGCWVIDLLTGRQ